MVFINETGTIHTIVGAFTNDVTGSLTLTIFLIFFFVVLIALIFRLSFTTISIMVSPLLIVWASYYSEAMAILFVVLIILALLFSSIFIKK